MIMVHIHLTVKDKADIDKVAKLLTEAGRLSRQEPGCARFEVYHSTADENRFFLVEYWESQEAIDGHRKGVPYTTIYQPQVLPLVVREPHPSKLLE